MPKHGYFPTHRKCFLEKQSRLWATNSLVEVAWVVQISETILHNKSKQRPEKFLHSPGTHISSSLSELLKLAIVMLITSLTHYWFDMLVQEGITVVFTFSALNVNEVHVLYRKLTQPSRHWHLHLRFCFFFHVPHAWLPHIVMLYAYSSVQMQS